MCWFQTTLASCSCFYHVDHTDQLLRHQPTLVLVTESLETESTTEEEEKEEKEDDDDKLEEGRRLDFSLCLIIIIKRISRAPIYHTRGQH